MKTMKQVTLVVLTPIFALLVFSQFVCAEVFKWVDDKGTVHYTEDPSMIPEKYRNHLERRSLPEDTSLPPTPSRPWQTEFFPLSLQCLLSISSK
jgi:hypothetical protein